MTAAPWPRQGVYKAAPGVWFAPSTETSPGAFWRVEWHHHPRTGSVYTCTCPRGQHAGQMAPSRERADTEKGAERPCRHVSAVQAAERADGYPPRPPARSTNVSALVD